MSRKRDGLYKRRNIFAFRYKDDAGLWREKQTGKRDRQEAKDFRSDFLSNLQSSTLPTHMAEWTLEQAKTWWEEFRHCQALYARFKRCRTQSCRATRFRSDPRTPLHRSAERRAGALCLVSCGELCGEIAQAQLPVLLTC